MDFPAVYSQEARVAGSLDNGTVGADSLTETKYLPENCAGGVMMAMRIRTR